MVPDRGAAPLAGTVHAEPAADHAGRGLGHRAGRSVLGARRVRGRHADFRDRIQAPGGRRHQAVPRCVARLVFCHYRHAAQCAAGAATLVAGAAAVDRPGTRQVRTDRAVGQGFRRIERGRAADRPGVGAGRRIRLRAAESGRRAATDGPLDHPADPGLDGAVDAGRAFHHRQVRCDRDEAGGQ